MKNYLLAYRYANALQLAIEEDAGLEPASETLDTLARLFQEDPSLHSALATPSIDVDQRVSVLLAVLTEESPLLVRRLAELLLRRGRVSLLPDVATVFRSLVDRRLNRVTAAVTTAEPLDESQEAALAAALSSYRNQTVRMDCAVDAEVLGGVVARLDGTLIDGSVRHRLERLRAALLAEEN